MRSVESFWCNRHVHFRLQFLLQLTQVDLIVHVKSLLFLDLSQITRFLLFQCLNLLLLVSVLRLELGKQSGLSWLHRGSEVILGLPRE